jgi:DMSO/TMAO reductase YedYZ molybdopterin-dependent catalytic subunit
MDFIANATAPAWRPTPLTALELGETPTDLHFIRDHFPVPALDPRTWSLELTGARRTISLDLAQIRTLPRHTGRAVLECAGHRRTEVTPLPDGLPWEAGALSEARWTGTGLAPLLHEVGVPSNAVELVLQGADSGPFEGRPGIHHYARGLPLEKALGGEVLLAYECNGEPIPVDRGGPVRAIVPGWYGTDSVKWLSRAWFTDHEFDGPFQADDYRLKHHDDPGPGERMTAMPIHSLITSPAGGERRAAGSVVVRGVAWGGQDGISAVLVRDSLGPWRRARLEPPRDEYSLVRWELRCTLGPGDHELACRAIDGTGGTQPDGPPSHAGGYANNSVHRIRVSIPG